MKKKSKDKNMLLLDFRDIKLFCWIAKKVLKCLLSTAILTSQQISYKQLKVWPQSASTLS